MAEAGIDSAARSFSLNDLLLPLNPAQYGPITRGLLIRTGLLLMAIHGVGLALTFGAGDAALRAAGLSMLLPGGGFLYAASPLLFLLTLVGMEHSEGIGDLDAIEAEEGDLLRALGCDQLQGYLLGRPMPEEDFLAHSL